MVTRRRASTGKDLSKGKKITEVDEALEGLVNLGFSREKAKQTLNKIPKEIKDAEEKIKQALKLLGK